MNLIQHNVALTWNKASSSEPNFICAMQLVKVFLIVLITVQQRTLSKHTVSSPEANWNEYS